MSKKEQENKLKIEYVEISKLKAYKNNPRINDNAIDAVSKSIKQFGFNSPILVDKDLNICAGHTRILAAKKLGLKTVPIIKLDLTETNFRGFNIADNKTASLSEWNENQLAKILQELQKEDLEVLEFGELGKI